jgi:hypothetical protein
MNKKTILLFIILIVFGGYVASVLVSRARDVDALYAPLSFIIKLYV